MYRELERKIQAWADNELQVRALVVIGSYAREKHTADRWSDLDLILFVSDAQSFTGDGTWLNRFGEIWLSLLQKAGSGIPEWLVIYGGGVKVDFLIAEANQSLSEALSGHPFGEVTRQGVRVLVNKGEPEPYQALGQEINLSLPQTETFEVVVKLFWLSAFRAASLIGRGDLWRARKIMDVTLRQLIVDMMAWHARAKKGPGLDTWHDGRYMEEWAYPWVVERLPALFVPFEIAASARALGEMIGLFTRMVEETAVQRQYPLPVGYQDRVRDWIESELRKIV